MKNEILFDQAVWEEFQKQAKRQRQNPATLLTGFMRECLETWEYKQLDKEMQRDAQTSEYTEDDAVELVRQYRAEKKAKRAAS
ncbi:MAG TPA: hypothetical protein PLK30_24735 [Blastocatellia bacterium]|nr:hypothetical protein [Blastocatellia bacterium]